MAEGTTLVHDWVYEACDPPARPHPPRRERALRDPHRLDVTGPTHFSGAEVSCPPALRPAVVILLAMLAAKGESVCANVGIIAPATSSCRSGSNSLGASIETFHD